MNKVSVIIPVWDRPLVLVRSLYSIITQTHQNFEVIVVGDGCISAMVQQYTQIIGLFNDQRIRFFNLGEHKERPRSTAGLEARNFGLQQVQGDFIAPLDDDNIWSPLHLEDCVHIMKNNDIGLVYGQYLSMKAHRRGVVTGRGVERGFKSSKIGHSVVVYKSQYRCFEYPDLPFESHGAADRSLWARMYEEGVLFHFDPKIHGVEF